MNAADFVKSYLDAWNRQDAQAVADHLSPDATYLDVPVQQQLSREELVKELDATFVDNSNFYELIGEVLAGERTIAFQYKVTSRDADDDGVWYGSEFINIEAERATGITDYYERPGESSPSSPFTDDGKDVLIKRYAKSGLSPQQMAAVQDELTTAMRDEQAYLNPNLTLPELADSLGTSVNHVSQAINAGFGKSFFDYINGYRVADAMDMLAEPKGVAQTVLDIALGVGFNSTSTFYVAFKKASGMTPAQYRRTRLAEADAQA